MGRIVLRQIARNILAGNLYMTLATVCPDGKPWAAPVVYAMDAGGKIYYVSQPGSLHSRNLKADPRVSVAIFDSRQKWGEGVGLQIEGKARLLPLTVAARAAKCYFGRKWPYPGSVDAVRAFKRMARGGVYRFYEVVPEQVWMNDPRAKKDVRVRVRI